MLGEPFVGEAGHLLNKIIPVCFNQLCEAVTSERAAGDVDLQAIDIGDFGGSLAKACDQIMFSPDADDKARSFAQEVSKRYPSLKVGVTNICCCIPYGQPEVKDGQRPVRPPNKEEAVACRPRLLELINIVRPKAIVTLGKVSTRFLPRPKDGLPAFVEFVEETIHPAALLRMQGDNPIQFAESMNRCLLKLTEVKKRIWGVD